MFEQIRAGHTLSPSWQNLELIWNILQTLSLALAQQNQQLKDAFNKTIMFECSGLGLNFQHLKDVVNETRFLKSSGLGPTSEFE